MAVYGFSSEDAKRIGSIVRHVEADRTGRSSGAGGFVGANAGVRLLLARYDNTCSWSKGATAVVTIHAGDVIASVETVVARNQFLSISTQTACTQRWVALGNNGFGWYVVNQEKACNATCSSEVGNIDFSVVPNYVATATQLLGHDASGCIKWFSTTTCATAA